MRALDDYSETVNWLLMDKQNKRATNKNWSLCSRKRIKCKGCIAPLVWAFLSTTVQLPATHRKVEGGERDIQLVHVNEANSCLARGYCVYCKLAQGEQCLSNPPPPSFPTAPPLDPRTPHAEFMWFSASSAKSEDGLYLGAQKCCSWIRTAFVIMYEFELKW